jgi:hypothetical protein
VEYTAFPTFGGPWHGAGDAVSPSHLEVPSMSIVRVGLAETKNFSEGYDLIFGKKEDKKAEEQKKDESCCQDQQTCQSPSQEQK